MKKILYVATVLSHICQFHLPYLKMFKEKGYEVHVAARDNLAEKNGLQLRYADKHVEIPFQRSPFAPKNLKALKQLKKLVNEEQYDLIICNTPVGGILTRLAAKKARKRGTKVVYIAHGFHFYKGASKKNWLIYYPIEKHFAKKCDTLVTITKEDYEFATKKFKTNVVHTHGIGVREDKYHPFSKDEQNQMRFHEKLSQDDFVVICTGELNKNKNQKVLISAAKYLKEKIPNLKVLLAGNGPLKDVLDNQVTENGLIDTVRFLGYRTDLEKVVPACDLVVSCSYREGLPLNIVEAMLCKKPVVASKNRGHNELVENGKNGYLFTPNSVEELVNCITAVYADENLDGMGEEGYRIVKKYAVSSVQSEMERVLMGTLEA